MLHRLGQSSGSIDLDVIQYIGSTAVHRIFLIPTPLPSFLPTDMNDIKSREWGWIDVRPGAIDDVSRVLTMTRFDVDDSIDGSFLGTKVIKWLKRRLHGEVTFGLKGPVNPHTGQSFVYRDIGYTRHALQLNREGFAWKQESTDRHTGFLPAT
jgi:hypothetical protein